MTRIHAFFFDGFGGEAGFAVGRRGNWLLCGGVCCDGEVAPAVCPDFSRFAGVAPANGA